MKKEKIINLVNKAAIVLPAIWYGNAGSLIVNANIDWIESELSVCRKTKEKLKDERGGIEKNLQETVQDIGTVREAYDTSRSKLDELTGITAQKKDVRRCYDNNMDTARDMQGEGALIERHGELVRANSMNEGRISGYSEGERQGAWLQSVQRKHSSRQSSIMTRPSKKDCLNP